MEIVRDYFDYFASSFWGAYGILAGVLMVWGIIDFIREKPLFRPRWVKVTLLILILLFAPFTAYYDLKLSSQVLEDEVTQSKTVAERRELKIAKLEQELETKPKTVTKTVPSPPEPRKCWLSQYDSVSPHPSVDAAYATAAIIFCNEPTPAPVYVAVVFDTELVPNAAWFSVLGGGVMIVSDQSTRGRKAEIIITLPPVRAYQPVVVKVHSEKPIRAVSAVMRTAK